MIIDIDIDGEIILEPELKAERAQLIQFYQFMKGYKVSFYDVHLNESWGVVKHLSIKPIPIKSKDGNHGANS